VLLEGVAYAYSGSKYIEKIGFREEWIGSEFWVRWSDFSGAGLPINFGDLTSLDNLPAEEVAGIRNAYLTQINSKPQGLIEQLFSSDRLVINRP
jgi:hypothetical protein